MPEEIVNPDILQDRPVETASPSDDTPPQALEPNADGRLDEAVQPIFDVEAEAAVLARLRALGYVE